MKTIPRILTQRLTSLLAASLLGGLILQAADAPPRERPAERGAPGAGAAAAPGAPAGVGAMRGAMLDEKQRDVLREAAQAHRDELRKLDEQMLVAQRDLMNAMLAEKQDEKVIAEKAQAVAKIQVAQTLLRAKIIAAVAPTLTQEQREQLQANPWMLNMLTGGAGGMGGMGGMRGPAARTEGAPPREGQPNRAR